MTVFMVSVMVPDVPLRTKRRSTIPNEFEIQATGHGFCTIPVCDQTLCRMCEKSLSMVVSDMSVFRLTRPPIHLDLWSTTVNSEAMREIRNGELQTLLHFDQF